MQTTLAFLLCIGAGIVGGVFFAFSSFVMKALAGLSPVHGIAAMQRINVVVLNPMFLGVFVGTAVLAGVSLVVSFFFFSGTRSILLFVAGVLYLVGSFGVTVACNVPRNERLARLDSDSLEATSYWPAYMRGWGVWNHVRSVASVLAACCSAAALVLAGTG